MVLFLIESDMFLCCWLMFFLSEPMKMDLADMQREAVLRMSSVTPPVCLDVISIVGSTRLGRFVELHDWQHWRCDENDFFFKLLIAKSGSQHEPTKKSMQAGIDFHTPYCPLRAFGLLWIGADIEVWHQSRLKLSQHAKHPRGHT